MWNVSGKIVIDFWRSFHVVRRTIVLKSSLSLPLHFVKGKALRLSAHSRNLHREDGKDTLQPSHSSVEICSIGGVSGATGFAKLPVHDFLRTGLSIPAVSI